MPANQPWLTRAFYSCKERERMTQTTDTKETKAQRAERLKREKNPWEAFDEVRAFAREGRSSVVPEWANMYFKWWGIYTQGDGVGATGGKGGEGLASDYFMMRIGIPNGIVSAAQLRVIAGLAQKHARNLADITVRQCIQLHWLTIESLPEVVDALNAIGLSPIFDAPFTHTPAFVGSHIVGYDNVLKGILEHFWSGKAKTAPVLERVANDKINFIGGFDGYTVGNLREIKRIFGLMGVDFTIISDNSDVWDTPTDGQFRMYDGGTTLEDTADAIHAKAEERRVGKESRSRRSRD